MISFQMFGEKYLMYYTNFSIRIELVDVEYTRTESFSQLHILAQIRYRPRHFRAMRSMNAVL